jgi:hypothetical protein
MDDNEFENDTAEENSKSLNSNQQQKLGAKRSTKSSKGSGKSFGKRLKNSFTTFNKIPSKQSTFRIDDCSGTESSESDDGGKIEFLVVPLVGNPILLNMYSDSTLFDLQDEIHSRLNIFPEMQQFCLSDRPIFMGNDEATLENIGIKSGSLLRLMPKMNSGLDNALTLEQLSDIELPEKLQFQSADILMQSLNIQCQVDPPKAPELPILNLLNNICQECKKRCRPGLQFKCRCGGIFCNIHRYNDSHKCSFDFKSHDRAILQQKMA